MNLAGHEQSSVPSAETTEENRAGSNDRTSMNSSAETATIADKSLAVPTASSLRRRWLKRIVSVWLLFHVAGIIVAPAAVSPSSQLLQSTWRLFRPYLQALYLNHGYHFFAPEPGSSTLVGYTLEFADGRTETGRFPHREIAPRLLYHRHFMLSEFLGFVPDDEEQPWHRSYARHLCHATGAERVSLSRITHDLPTPRAIAEGRTLTDSEGYSEVPLGSFECVDF